MCSYCHTRTEQQFHPEIYKSTKCNDVQQSGYCPRGVFCAFAHVERESPPSGVFVFNFLFLFAEEMGVSRDTGESGTNFADILSNALPPSSLDKSKEKSSDSSVSFSLNMCRENATLIRRVASGFAETLRYFCTC
jgi:hypothetical protein